MEKGIKEYSLQLHCYDLLFSNLENDEVFIKKSITERYPNWGSDAINKHTDNRLQKISEINIKKTSLLGLVYVYPEKLIKGDSILVDFSFSFEKVNYEPQIFMNILTDYIENLEKPFPPEIPQKCKDLKEKQHCVMHAFFYEQKKLKNVIK